MDLTHSLESYYKRLASLYRSQCIECMLSWDLNVCTPPNAAQARADQIEYMSLDFHEKSMDPEFGRVVDELFEHIDELGEEDKTSVRLTKRALDIERKLPEDFVAEYAQVTSVSFDVWAKARPANDFATVKPFLEKIVALAKRRSELLGYEDHPYDPLLDLFDPGAKTAVVKPLLTGLAEEIRSMLPAIIEKTAGRSELQGQFSKADQERLCRKVAQDLGFDFQSGRLDVAPHPFMTALGPNDFRITTRYNESSFIPSLYGVMHETGHALYEIGMPASYYKNPPMGSPMSLSIHESQSRMWENLVGRSREFSRYLSPLVAEFFPGEAAALTAGKLSEYANLVRPSLIRVEADEVTYSLHVVIRMLLEEQLITDKLTVADLPEAWDDLYEQYIGVRPTDYKNGVMQDMQWYAGAIGYFPTYAMGNLYNAMMMETARKAIPNLPTQIEKGEFAGLLGWLRENVHRHGMRYPATELIRNITGSDLSAKPFVDYLRTKFLS